MATTATAVTVTGRGPPPYGKRGGWVPRTEKDFGDGGAFPEIKQQAQYPLGMGLKKSKSNALALQVDQSGAVNYEAIARQGVDNDRIIQSSFKELIPLRQRADVGEVSLERPTAEDVEATAERTRAALEKIATGQVALKQPKNVKVMKQKEPTYVRYTPTSQMGEATGTTHGQRIIKLVERVEDPMEPSKFKQKKLPRGPPTPPPPIMHSPPRKVTAEQQAEWRIPPAISNWKNPKGFTIALDKRMAADGRGLMDVQINDNFAKLSEALGTAERHARDEIRQRASLQQKLAEKQKLEKEEHLRMLAQKARDERAGNIATPASDEDDDSDNGHRRRRRTRRDNDDSSEEEDEEAARERNELRRERRQEAERKMRMARMGNEQKLRVLARENDRDISEKVALGLAKPTASKESMFDARLYNQSVGGAGFGADDSYNVYDRPLFAAQSAAQSIYRPRGGADADENEEDVLAQATKGNRFEVLGRAQKGFRGADLQEAREGPVVFNKAAKDTAADFGIDAFLGDVEKSVNEKRKLGLNTKQDYDDRTKRARHHDSDGDD